MVDTLIENLSKYVELTPADAQVIESLFTPRKYRKKQYIAQEGEITRNEIFIVKGLIRTYEVDDKGQEHILMFGMEDWWAGDLYSFLTETPSRYNIDCLEDTETLQINKPNLETLYEKVPKMERHFRLIIQNAFIASTKRLASSLAKSAAERYDEFVTKYPQFEQRLPDHQIASYLGITPQSLSRIRSQASNKAK